MCGVWWARGFGVTIVVASAAVLLTHSLVRGLALCALGLWWHVRRREGTRALTTLGSTCWCWSLRC